MKPTSAIPLVAFIIALLLAACRHKESEEIPWYLDTVQLWSRYEAAVQDARVATVEEICHALPAITTPEDNPQIAWDTAPDGHRLILVTSLTNTATAAQWTASQPFEAPTEELIWVTLPYDLEAHVRTLPPCRDSLECAMRILQLLGLPPNCDYDRMVLLSLSPTGLLRPTPDPEIDDHQASLHFPAEAPQHYRTWFERNAVASYTSANRYPWTRLGYTYNWSADAASPVGPGEFVIHPATKVHIKQVTTIWKWYKKTMND